MAYIMKLMGRQRN